MLCYRYILEREETCQSENGVCAGTSTFVADEYERDGTPGGKHKRRLDSEPMWHTVWRGLKSHAAGMGYVKWGLGVVVVWGLSRQVLG